MTTYHIWWITVINWLVTSVYITAYDNKAARIQYGPCPNLKKMIKSKLDLQPFFVVRISSWTVNIDNGQHFVLCIRYLCKLQETGNPWDKEKSIRRAFRYEHSNRGADKSLARPGTKEANISFKMAWISFSTLPCRKKKNLMTARILMLLKSCASLTCFRACFIPRRAKDLSAPR